MKNIEMAKIVSICDRINSCSSSEKIEQTKKEIISELDGEHTEKMNKLNDMKARHDEELDSMSKEINDAIASNDFVKVQDLLTKQAELIIKQGMEMLSVM